MRIDDDLLRDLKRRAVAEKVSLTQLINHVLRQGMVKRPAKRTAYREQVFSMGQPRVSLDKALTRADADQDAEAARKLEAPKRDSSI